MGTGHLAVGLMLKRAAPEINIGWLFLAAMLSDFLLGIFFWLGLEQASIPVQYTDAHSVAFSFPYSHGLLAVLIWSALTFLLAGLIWKKKNAVRVGIVLAIAVFSHFVLDFIVHRPELPILGRDSFKLGLGLWDQMSIALSLEMLLVVVEAILYWNSTAGKSPGGKIGVLILVILFSIVTIVGMTSTTPPNLTVLAISWLATPLVLSGVAFWLDREKKS